MIRKKITAIALAVSLASGFIQNPVRVEALSVDELYANAYRATVSAMEGKNQKLINEARTAIKMLPQNLNWAIGEFSKQVDNIQHPIFEKAYKAVVLAEKNPTQANIDAAKEAIDPDMPIYYRGSYSSKIDEIQQNKMKEALDAYKKALETKLEADMDKVNKLLEDIKTSKNLVIAEWAELVQAKGKLEDLSNSKINTNNYAILSNSGVYGPTNQLKPTTVKGNILVSNSNGKTLTLQNINIEGTLTVNFGSGDVVLNNVKVNGVTVNNIGANSLHVKGESEIKNISIKDSDNDARIVLEDNASIQNANVLSGAKLEVAKNSTNSKAFENVVISPNDTKNVILDGSFTNVSVDKAASLEITKGSKVSDITLNSDAVVTGTGSIEKLKVETSGVIDIQAKSIETLEVSKKAEGAKVNLSEETKVVTLNVNSSVNVTGKGTIENANIGANGTTIEIKPGNVSVTEGVKVEVGGEVKDESNSNVIEKVPEITEKPETPEKPEENTPPVVVPPSNDGSTGGNTGGSTGGNGGQSQPSYNTPGGQYTGPEIKFNATSTSSENPSLLGPSTGVSVIKSDIVINAGEGNVAKLRNIEVYGNITVNGKNGKAGSIILDNVKVYQDKSKLYGIDSGAVYVKDGAKIDVKNSQINELEFVSTDKVSRSIENAKLELKDNSVIEELLVKTENVEINVLEESIKFIQGDGVKLENIKTNSTSNLKKMTKTVNTEEKLKEKISEINGLYRTSNGITETRLYDYVNNKLRILIETLVDMEVTCQNGEKFTLPETYKKFNLSQRISISGHINGYIPELPEGKVTDLYQLRTIMNKVMPFAIREIEISKYLGRDGDYNIDISKLEVGKTVEEMFKVKEGEKVNDYYTFELLKTDGDFTQFYNNEITLMKNFALKREVQYAYDYSYMMVRCKADIPSDLKTNDTQTNLRFKYNNLVGLNKDISFVDIAKTSSGIRIVLRAQKNDPSIEMSAKDFTFNINGKNVDTTIDSSISEKDIMTYNGDYIYIYNIENSNLNKDEKITLTTTFSENDKTYEYKKQFNLKEGDIEGIYKFEAQGTSKSAIERNELKIKALEKASDYSEGNKRYLLNLELSSYYNTNLIPNINEYDFWDFSGMCSKMYSSNIEIPIVEVEDSEIIIENGKPIIQIPLVLKEEPKENEIWTISIQERSDKVIVDPISFIVDFSDVAEKEEIKVETKIEIKNIPHKVKVEQILSDESGKIENFDIKGREATSVSLIKGTDDYSNVRLVVEGSDDLSGIELIAQDSVGNWYNIVKTGWGPNEGFELANATTEVYIVANRTGNYKAKVKLIDVNKNKVITESRVIQIEADGEAPKILKEPSVKSLTKTSIEFEVKVDEHVKAYYMLVDSGKEKPTFEQIMKEDEYSSDVYSYGDFYCGVGESIVKFGFLKENISYTMYFFLEDEAGNRQDEITSLSFNTGNIN